MGRVIQREKDVEFDLESGGTTSEEDASNDDRESKSAFRWAWNGVVNFDGSDKGKFGVQTCTSSANSGDFVGCVDESSLELLVDKGLDLEHVQHQLAHVNVNNGKQKIMLTNPRKPPLPPKGPSLDAGDHKFVKELAELALRKRARIKKMKAVRKMRASKKSSSSTYTSVSAMVITIIFFLVIILHGVDSKEAVSLESYAQASSSESYAKRNRNGRDGNTHLEESERQEIGCEPRYGSSFRRELSRGRKVWSQIIHFVGGREHWLSESA